MYDTSPALQVIGSFGGAFKRDPWCGGIYAIARMARFMA
jgi:hypothetical protein